MTTSESANNDHRLPRGSGAGTDTSVNSGPQAEDTLCFVCGEDLSALSGVARNAHVGACLGAYRSRVPWSNCIPDGAPQAEFGPDGDDYDMYEDNEDDPHVNQHGRKHASRADGQWDGAAFAGRAGGGDKAAKGDRW